MLTEEQRKKAAKARKSASDKKKVAEKKKKDQARAKSTGRASEKQTEDKAWNAKGRKWQRKGKKTAHDVAKRKSNDGKDALSKAKKARQKALDDKGLRAPVPYYLRDKNMTETQKKNAQKHDKAFMDSKDREHKYVSAAHKARKAGKKVAPSTLAKIYGLKK